jgi:hypothetical protein
MRALILFMHIVGGLILFAGLALESVGLRQMRRSATLSQAAPWLVLFSLLLGLYPVALAVLLLTGGYLASNVAVWQFGWVRISMATLVITTLAGIIAAWRVRALFRQPPNGAPTVGPVDARLRASWLHALLVARGAATLGIVYVMVSKPGGVPTLIVIVTAAVVAVAMATFVTRRSAKGIAALSPGCNDVGDYAISHRQEA